MNSLTLTVQPVSQDADPIQTARKLREMADAYLGDLVTGETYEEVLRAAEQALDTLALSALPVSQLRQIANAAHRDSSIRTKGALISALRRIVTDPIVTWVGTAG